MKPSLLSDLNRNTKLNASANHSAKDSKNADLSLASPAASSTLASKINEVKSTINSPAATLPYAPLPTIQVPSNVHLLSADDVSESLDDVKCKIKQFEALIKTKKSKKRNIAVLRHMKKEAEDLLEAISILMEKKFFYIGKLTLNINDLDFNQPLEGLAAQLAEQDKSAATSEFHLHILMKHSQNFKSIINEIDDIKYLEKTITRLNQDKYLSELFSSEPLKIINYKKFITFTLFMNTASVIENCAEIYSKFLKLSNPHDEEVRLHFLKMFKLCYCLNHYASEADITKTSEKFCQFKKKFFKEMLELTSKENLSEIVTHLGEEAQAFFDWFNFNQKNNLSKEELSFLEPLIEQFFNLAEILPNVFESLVDKPLINLFYPKKSIP